MSRYLLYATRPAPAAPPYTVGAVLVVPRGGYTEHTLLDTQNFATLAMDALLLAHEKHTSFAHHRGWEPPVDGLGHALYEKTPRGPRRAELAAHITGTTLTVAHSLTRELPPGHVPQALDSFAATYHLITQHPPTRTPHLITVVTPDADLRPATKGEPHG